MDGAPLEPVSFVDVESKSKVLNTMLRVDSWILPFLNVYVMGGYTYNESVSAVTVTLPGPGNRQVTFDVPADLDGPTFGGGITLAAGYANFFLSIDANWSRTDLGAFSSTIDVFLGSIRTGWFGRFGKTEVRIWTGVTYWDTARTIGGVVDLPGGGTVQFEVEQGPVTDLSVIFGGNIELSKRFSMVFEVQVLRDVFMVLGSFSWRF